MFNKKNMKWYAKSAANCLNRVAYQVRYSMKTIPTAMRQRNPATVSTFYIILKSIEEEEEEYAEYENTANDDIKDVDVTCFSNHSSSIESTTMKISFNSDDDAADGGAGCFKHIILCIQQVLTQF